MPASGTSSDRNYRYYSKPLAGREDYWRSMAAPRHRVATFLRVVRELAPHSVVDLGCGNGSLLDELRQALGQVSLAGVDFAEAQLDRNRERCPETGWHVLDLDAPLPAEHPLRRSADVVIAAELIEHLERPLQLLRHAWELASPGNGHLLLSTQSGPVRQTERIVGHRRHFSRVEMEELLRQSGWQPLRVWNTGFPFHDLSKWYANLRPEASLRRFGDRAYGPFEVAVCLALRAAFAFNSKRRGAQLFALARHQPRQPGLRGDAGQRADAMAV